ncbi:MAG: 16S rRNA (cytosine(1402)-N(4))-methyltransferase RsmH [Nitrospirae bacterium]|nr:16S rRNA (cytosine(1402)-N(4))-methyltransferase RsmH [Nitrospirota bacterium]
MDEPKHTPVLLNEVKDFLRCSRPGIYVDFTVGAGGHAKEILASSPENRLIGFDWDEQAIEIASENLQAFSNRVTLVHEGFPSFKATLENSGISEVDGMVFDLGLSSIQIDSQERGFSFREDSPLDMRMDRRMNTTAADLVNNLNAEKLIKIITVYGEERYARNIVHALIRERDKEAITSTSKLADIVRSAVPPSYRFGRIHPATKTFQALRIAVNNELEGLDKIIRDAVGYLKSGGRICIISFHSLEDRIVKNTFRNLEKPCICPPRIPYCVCGMKSKLSILTRKPVVPSDAEIAANPRSRSAKLRVAEKI